MNYEKARRMIYVRERSMGRELTSSEMLGELVMVIKGKKVDRYMTAKIFVDQIVADRQARKEPCK